MMSISVGATLFKLRTADVIAQNGLAHEKTLLERVSNEFTGLMDDQVTKWPGDERQQKLLFSGNTAYNILIESKI